MCAFKGIPPPYYSQEVLPAPLLFLANCGILSQLILNLFGSRGFVAADLCLGNGSCLEALPFSEAHGVPQYCQVLLHFFAVQVTMWSQNYLSLRSSRVPPDQARVIAIQQIPACTAYLGYVFACASGLQRSIDL